MKKGIVSAIAVICFGAICAWTDDTAVVFKTSVNLGATATRGNSETFLLNGSWTLEAQEADRHVTRLGAEANYGESTIDEKDETTVDNAKAYLGHEVNLSRRLFAALNGSLAYDNIADVDYRAILGPAMGVYLWKTDGRFLSVQAGPSYLWEKVGGKRDEFTTLQGVERFEYKLSDTSKLWQSAEWLPKVEDFEVYLLNAEVGAEASLTSRLKLRVVLQDKYNSNPAEGKKHNDLAIIAGVGLAL